MKQINKIVLIIIIINLFSITNTDLFWGKTILNELAGNGGDSDNKTFHFDSGNVNFQMKKQDYTTTITNAEVNSVYCTPDGMTIYNDGIEYIKTYGFNLFGTDLSGGNWTNNAYPSEKNVAIDPLTGKFKFSQDYSWHKAVQLQNGNCYQQSKIAFDSTGNGMCVYQHWSDGLWRVYAKKYNGTNWESAVCIDANNGYDSYHPQVDFNGSGNAIVIFRQYTSSFTRIYANKYNGTSWGIAECIDEGDFSHNMGDCLALDCESSGKAIAVFNAEHLGVWRIYANVYDGTNWGTAECIDNSNNNFEPKIALDGNGNAICVFTESNNWTIYANKYNGTNWEGPVEIKSAEAITRNALNPEVAFDTLGNAICVFTQERRPSFTWYSRVYANRYNGTNWEGAILIDSVPGNTNTIQDWSRMAIDFNSNNNAFATFYQWNGSNYRIYANKYTSGSGWGTAELIDAGALNAINIDHDIAYNGNEIAIAVFTQTDGTHQRIYANVYDGSNWGTAELIDFTSSFDATEPPRIKFTNVNNNAMCIFSQKYDTSWSRIYYSKYKQAFPLGTVRVDYNNDTPPPGEWSNFASRKLDLSWISESETNDDVTPSCRIQVRDTILGLDVSSAQTNYSIDGGTTWQYPFDLFDDASLGSNWTSVNHNSTGGSAVENGTELTIEGEGTDVWSSNDEFYIVYDTLEGNFSVEVKLNSQEDTDQYAKAGILVRNAIATQSNNGYCVIAELPQYGWQFLYDNDSNGYLESSYSAGTTTYPCYLKLTKLGTSFTGYYSLNGLNWIEVGNATLSDANLTQIVGMFVCSQKNDTLCSVKFDHFKAWKLTPCSGTNGSTSFETVTSLSVPFNQFSDSLNKIKFNIADIDGTIGYSPIYNVKIANTILSLSINSSSYDFGTVLKNSTNVATSSITVSNNGNVNERYSLNLASPAGWTYVTDTAPGVEEFRMCGNFQTATAQASHFVIAVSSSDAIGTTQRVCSTGDFSKDDEGETAKGYNVPSGQDRHLWFRFESPTSTSLTTQQTITVTVTAEQQP